MRNYIAEVLGTFAIVFCGTGAIIIDQQTGGVITHVGVAITFGLIVMSMIFALGNISGAHFNPAVTVGFYFSGRFPAREITPYIIAQLFGAFGASGLLRLIFPDNASLGATIPAGAYMQSFVLELVLTFFLMLVIIHVAHGSKEQGMFAGPVCGASMNPARSLAPGVVSGQLGALWIYVTAPVAGAIGAVYVWKYLHPAAVSA